MHRPATALICHHDAPLHHDGIARWMASWSDLVAIVVVEEPRSVLRRRIRREIARVGAWRMLDVLAMRAYYRLAVAARDGRWMQDRLRALQQAYPPVPASVPVLRVRSPNAPEVQAALASARPDLVLALCKNILAERIFSIPAQGTFVLHPGICPEYRNAHGCFWALARDDLERVGATMLRIDKGIDTGPVFGYYSAPFDERRESHIVIQHRMVLDNLPALAEHFQEIARGEGHPLSTAGRESHEWGQPWLTRYLRWKRQARRRGHARAGA
jgi:methionyl-tRNA formyltransferase